jgi:uncharacterized membrane-anchored protein
MRSGFAAARDFCASTTCAKKIGMYFVHRRDFLDKPVNAGGLALSRRVASAALGVIIVILIWSCRNAADAIPSATVDA